MRPAGWRLKRAGVICGAAVLALSSCGSDGKTLRPPTFPLPAPPVTEVPVVGDSASPILPEESPVDEPEVFSPETSSPETSSPETSSPETSSPETADGRISIEELFSPANATAEMVGVGAVLGDPVTVDDAPGDVLDFDVEPDGSFRLQVWIPDEGAHTVCVADTCGRVYTLAPDAESPEEVIAKIEQAIPMAADILPTDELFPDWTIEIGGALSGTGGSTDVEAKTVTIYRNRGRTLDEFVRTILHEFGHVADAERLTDAERADYLELRGLPADMTWRDEDAHRLDDWGQQPSEDFAEVMVTFWTDGRYEPRTALAPTPDAATLLQIAQLAEFG